MAIVTALLVVAIVATSAAFLSLGQQVWLRQAQNLSDRAQAETVRSGALEWAAIILTEDAKDNATDDLTEAWAQDIPPLPAESGLVTGRIVDAQGQYNLNNLVRRGQISNDDVAVFQRLLVSQELAAELADSVVDWLDTDANTQPSGAEDIDYLNVEPPYRAANQLLQSIGELRLVKGFDRDTVEKLRPLITALPEATSININTAPSAVLSALFPDLSLSEADDLVSQRDENPFSDVGQLKERLPSDVALPKVPYDIKSSYFEVTIDTLFGRLQRQTVALLHRPSGTPVKVLWQQRQLLVTQESKEGDGAE
ncbi:MAG: type II secretion system minor pseudopilin GspK [Gammaproteobacteria bacterium]|nr:type II secretion system minor pseudopilin GspK [Gammaproteobacteria bacterium]